MAVPAQEAHSLYPDVCPAARQLRGKHEGVESRKTSKREIGRECIKYFYMYAFMFYTQWYSKKDFRLLSRYSAP